MSKIQVLDLQPVTGHDFFVDSESFLAEISQDELPQLKGGFTWSVVASIVVVGMNVYAGYKHGRWDRR